jgi:hypothetical protein
LDEEAYLEIRRLPSWLWLRASEIGLAGGGLEHFTLEMLA